MDRPRKKAMDRLTGLPDFDAFLEALAEAIADAGKQSGSVSIALVDIDRFKKLNDEYGREAGDEVLKSLSAHLTDAAVNLGPVFRYGGDEFLILMPTVEKEEAFLALEQARNTFGGDVAFTHGGKKAKVPVTISIGVATYPEDGSRSQDVLRKANDAMYRSKAGKGNRVCLAREERMVTKTSHYTQGQLERLSQLAKREGVGEAILLREALDEVLRKYAL